MSILRGDGLPNQFSHKAAKDLAGFAGSFNNASQAVAWASADGASTGTKMAMFGDGDIIAALPADAAYDWSADTQLGVWTTGQSYTTADMKYILDANGKKNYYMCIAAHTSSASNKPGARGWEAYWKLSDQTAEPALGTVLADGQSVFVLVLATKTGVLTVVKAGDVALDAAVECKIPRFEPEMFVPMAIMEIDAGGAVTLGTTDISAIVTITQLTHPVYPHNDNL